MDEVRDIFDEPVALALDRAFIDDAWLIRDREALSAAGSPVARDSDRPQPARGGGTASAVLDQAHGLRRALTGITQGTAAMPTKA